MKHLYSDFSISSARKKVACIIISIKEEKHYNIQEKNKYEPGNSLTL